MRAPLRLRRLAAWIDACEACGILWVERLDEPVMDALVKRLACERAVASFPASERERMAREIAGELADHRRTVDAIEALRLWLLSVFLET